MSGVLDRDAHIDKLLAVIKAWIISESGPTHMDFSSPKLSLKVKIRGYKKIILERHFNENKT